MNLALASEDAVRRKLSGSETHSSCHGTLEIVDHAVQHVCDVLTDGLRRGKHQFAGYRIALLRHRRRGASAGHERFGHFAEFGRRHQHDVGRDLAERSGDKAQQCHGLGYAVTRDVPGHRWLAKAELLAEQLMHGKPPFPD